jgi:hypothetical protein
MAVAGLQTELAHLTIATATATTTTTTMAATMAVATTHHGQQTDGQHLNTRHSLRGQRDIPSAADNHSRVRRQGKRVQDTALALCHRVLKVLLVDRGVEKVLS